MCDNRELRVEGLDDAVWQAVCAVLEHPQRIAEEYQARSAALAGTTLTQEARAAQAQLSRVRQGIARLIDSYADGLIEKAEFEPRVVRLRNRLGELEARVAQLGELVQRSTDIEQIIGCLEEFATQVRTTLGTVDWAAQRAIIRALVKSIELDHDEVHIVFQVGADPFDLRPEGGVWKHCWRRVEIAFGESGMDGGCSGLRNRWNQVWMEAHMKHLAGQQQSVLAQYIDWPPSFNCITQQSQMLLRAIAGHSR